MKSRWNHILCHTDSSSTRQQWQNGFEFHSRYKCAHTRSISLDWSIIESCGGAVPYIHMWYTEVGLVLRLRRTSHSWVSSYAHLHLVLTSNSFIVQLLHVCVSAVSKYRWLIVGWPELCHSSQFCLFINRSTTSPISNAKRLWFRNSHLRACNVHINLK